MTYLYTDISKECDLGRFALSRALINDYSEEELHHFGILPYCHWAFQDTPEKAASAVIVKHTPPECDLDFSSTVWLVLRVEVVDNEDEEITFGVIAGSAGTCSLTQGYVPFDEEIPFPITYTEDEKQQMCQSYFRALGLRRAQDFARLATSPTNTTR